MALWDVRGASGAPFGLLLDLLDRLLGTIRITREAPGLPGLPRAPRLAPLGSMRTVVDLLGAPQAFLLDATGALLISFRSLLGNNFGSFHILHFTIWLCTLGNMS